MNFGTRNNNRSPGDKRPILKNGLVQLGTVFELTLIDILPAILSAVLPQVIDIDDFNGYYSLSLSGGGGE